MSEQPTQAMEPPAPTTPEPQQRTPWVKYGAIGCAGILAVCIFIGALTVLVSSNDDDGDTDEPIAEEVMTPAPAPTTTSQPTPEPRSTVRRLGTGCLNL